MTTTQPPHTQSVPRKLFATLTDIRQTGTQREWDGTITYSFQATIMKDAPPVVLTLTVTPALLLQVQAHFDLQQHHQQEGDASR